MKIPAKEGIFIYLRVYLSNNWKPPNSSGWSWFFRQTHFTLNWSTGIHDGASRYDLNHEKITISYQAGFFYRTERTWNHGNYEVFHHLVHMYIYIYIYIMMMMMICTYIWWWWWWRWWWWWWWWWWWRWWWWYVHIYIYIWWWWSPYTARPPPKTSNLSLETPDTVRQRSSLRILRWMARKTSRNRNNGFVWKKGARSTQRKHMERIDPTENCEFNIAIETMAHLVRWFTYDTWWFSSSQTVFSLTFSRNQPTPPRYCRDQQRQGGQEVGERRSRLLHQQQTTNGLRKVRGEFGRMELWWFITVYKCMYMFIHVYKCYKCYKCYQ